MKFYYKQLPFSDAVSLLEYAPYTSVSHEEWSDGKGDFSEIERSRENDRLVSSRFRLEWFDGYKLVTSQGWTVNLRTSSFKTLTENCAEFPELAEAVLTRQKYLMARLLTSSMQHESVHSFPPDHVAVIRDFSEFVKKSTELSDRILTAEDAAAEDWMLIPRIERLLWLHTGLKSRLI
jgi:hypothetical protein